MEGKAVVSITATYPISFFGAITYILVDAYDMA